MPTYACWTRRGQLSHEQRQRIATALTEAHHQIAKAPRYFVQVIFNDLDEGHRFIAGQPADVDHIWIRGDIREGRSEGQKAELMQRILSDVAEIAGAIPENIWIHISDIPGPSVVEFGQSLPQPGEEAAWFSRLPLSLQQVLGNLA
jgi:phenylpyruvate tautomerase PptA (4-oxalocrotonate tautomerase family)